MGTNSDRKSILLLVRKSLFRIAVLVILPCLIAITLNLARSEPLAWVASMPYEIYADCPETYMQATAISIKDVLKNRSNFLIVDSRTTAAIQKDSPNGSILVPYDALFPVADTSIKKISESKGNRQILVIGDGQEAELLANELSERELTGVRFLENPDAWKRLVEE